MASIYAECSTDELAETYAFVQLSYSLEEIPEDVRKEAAAIKAELDWRRAKGSVTK